MHNGTRQLATNEFFLSTFIFFLHPFTLETRGRIGPFLEIPYRHWYITKFHVKYFTNSDYFTVNHKIVRIPLSLKSLI